MRDAQVLIPLMRVRGGFLGVQGGPRRAQADVHHIAGMRNRYTPPLPPPFPDLIR